MKRLRSGYTTGACAAAAAKAATLMLSTGFSQNQATIPFPDGSRVTFQLCACQWQDLAHTTACAAVIKDAGDDPDVTNKARIEAVVRFATADEVQNDQIIIAGGTGIGTVTKPGLSIPVGEPAINPIPRKMIREAATEALSLSDPTANRPLVVTISIPNGAELAEKTLNHRLGIIGGLSILGTTGIVRPISAEAWTATISTSMDVAREAGVETIVLSTGRTSESTVQQQLRLPDEAYVMMGDYLQFSLEDAGKHGFSAIHLAAMWAKVLKGAMRIPQTHVRHGALEIENAISFLEAMGTAPAILQGLAGSNTAREIYERLVAMNAHDTIRKVCCAARDYCQDVSGLPVTVYLVHSSRQIVESIPGNLPK
ncbi:MAG: cobalt-precorrin-5B (C(1))-methyltransferase CbiD [Desulfocapsaceae bacterium]|nr:cobalt-precorrin-5B (C(1))-methyltransferase CbiD [Desulfocapsaceae bacterium]